MYNGNEHPKWILEKKKHCQASVSLSFLAAIINKKFTWFIVSWRNSSCKLWNMEGKDSEGYLNICVFLPP